MNMYIYANICIYEYIHTYIHTYVMCRHIWGKSSTIAGKIIAGSSTNQIP